MAGNGGASVEEKCIVKLSGVDLIRNPVHNKGQAFTIRERQVMGIHGLLPPSVLTQDQQVYVALQNFYSFDEPLNKYIYLMGLQDRNERLFYRVVTENIEEMMPIIYTPTVGLACQKYGLAFRRPRGLFITIHDKGHIYDILSNWPEQDVRAIVVTDGERILGLGDLGAYGMGIPVGKLGLYTACANVQPYQCLPITLDVGTNNEKLLKDPLYIGLRQKRVTGEKYDEFVDEFMAAVVKKYGQKTLIQFEDFGNHNAFRFLAKYRDMYCTFNDDIQGTAAVTVAGLLAATRITKKSLEEGVFLFQGAGEAAIGIAKLLIMALKDAGLGEDEARKRIWMVDSRGLIVKDRPKGGINEEKAYFAQEHEPVDKLGDAVKQIKPSAIIGVAAVSGAFTKEIIEDMASFNEHPIIFALSNPTANAECTAEDAYKYTKGKAVFASGSPFKPVTLDGKTHYPGQGNNAYIFPGVALGVIVAGVRHISEKVFLEAAKGLSSTVTDEDLKVGRVYPHLREIKAVSTHIAVAVVENAYKDKSAATYPEPDDKEEYVKSQMYSTDYESYLPDLYDWPSGSNEFQNPLQGPFCFKTS